MCVNGAVPLASSHGLHVLAPLPLCIACVCQQCSFNHLFPWLECVSTIITAASMRCSRALAAQLQSPPRMACMCCRSSHSHLLAWLVCGDSDIPVAFSYGLHVSALQLQSPPCIASVLAVQPDSPFCIACVCWQCCPSRHHALLVRVKEASDGPGACLAAGRNGVSWRYVLAVAPVGPLVFKMLKIPKKFAYEAVSVPAVVPRGKVVCSRIACTLKK